MSKKKQPKAALSVQLPTSKAPDVADKARSVRGPNPEGTSQRKEPEPLPKPSETSEEPEVASGPSEVAAEIGESLKSSVEAARFAKPPTQSRRGHSAGKGRKTAPAKSQSPMGPSADELLSEVRVPLNVRVPLSYRDLLTDISKERKLSRSTVWKKQDIVEEALTEWFAAVGEEGGTPKAQAKDESGLPPEVPLVPLNYHHTW